MKTRDLELQLFENDIIFAFSGAITYTMLSSVALCVKKDLENHADSKELADMYLVFIEMLQNVMEYSQCETDTEQRGYGTCFVKQDKDRKFEVMTGNIIRIKDEKVLTQRVDTINSLEKDELKAEYRRVRQIKRVDTKDNAGLGLLTIARNSRGKFEYNISTVDEQSSYFEISVKI